MDTLSPKERSERMSRVRAFNTKPELAVRRLIHSLGYRYRLHDRRLPARPDIVFSKRKKVIFVHGCFWHRHPDCKLARLPKSRQEFWITKLEANALRDAENLRRLCEMGWKTMVVWECEVQRDRRLGDRIISFLGPPK